MHSKRAAYRLTLTTSPNYFHLLFSNCASSLLRKIFLCSGNQREETTFVLNSEQKSLIDRFGDYETHLLHIVIVIRKHMTTLRNPFDAFDFRNFVLLIREPSMYFVHFSVYRSHGHLWITWILNVNWFIDSPEDYNLLVILLYVLHIIRMVVLIRKNIEL